MCGGSSEVTHKGCANWLKIYTPQNTLAKRHHLVTEILATTPDRDNSAINIE